MNLAIIPARCGSKRIPHKNCRLFHGRPIISYSIETARESGLFAEIIVSTDSQDYAALAKAYGAKVHMRPARFCDDNVGTQEVMKVALNWWNVCHPNKPPKYACGIYATAPMLSVQDLHEGYAWLDRMPYAYMDGMYYWGEARNFLLGMELSRGVRIVADPARHIDINTEEDFQIAEVMYGRLREVEQRG